MDMSILQKERCSDIFELYTDIETEPSRWDQEAADMLANMVWDIKNCTKGMGAARAVWPSAPKITWMWLVKIPYHLIRNEVKLQRGYVNTHCLNQGIIAYRDSIQWELIK